MIWFHFAIVIFSAFITGVLVGVIIGGTSSNG